MQILYQDSAAFPTMKNNEELVRIIFKKKFECLLEQILGQNDKRRLHFMCFLSTYLEVRIIGLLGRTATPEIFNC